MITRFLPEPDERKTNPHYKSAHQMLLYDEQRVASIEASEEFIASHSKVNQRKAAAKKAVKTKRQKVLESVNRVQIDVPRIDRKTLLTEAIRNYNEEKQLRALERDNWKDWQAATVDSAPEFLDRLMVNWLRHCTTVYDDELEKLSGKGGVDEAYWLLKREVLNRIVAIYPELAHECARQGGRSLGE